MNKIIIIIGIVLILGLTGCSNSLTGSVISGKTVEKPTYSFGGPKNINMLPLVADRLGFFEDQGLDMERNDIMTGKMTMDALIKGDVDFGTLVETNIAFINFQGDPEIEVIAIIEEKTDDAIIANRNKGISSVKDLEGKRIAVTKGTGSHAYVMAFLKKNDVSNVELVNMPPPSIQAAVINGQVDAGTVWQPFRYNIEENLPESITFNDREVYVDYAIIAVRKDFAQKNPEAIDSFLKALIDAEAYYDENPGKVREMMSEELNIPLARLESTWHEYILEVSMKDELLDTIVSEAEWIVEEKGFEGKEIPDYEDSFNIGFLKKIDASRVEWE